MRIDIFSSEENLEFTEEEKNLIESIGAENFDYCLTAILQERYPDHNIILKESREVIRIDDSIDLEFNSETWRSNSTSCEESLLWAANYIGSLFIENANQLVN